MQEYKSKQIKTFQFTTIFSTGSEGKNLAAFTFEQLILEK